MAELTCPRCGAGRDEFESAEDFDMVGVATLPEVLPVRVICRGCDARWVAHYHLGVGLEGWADE